MTQQPCNSTDHLFVPILEVSIPLLRCIHCNVFAYHETVKELARNRRYYPDVEPRVLEIQPAPVPELPYWRRMWSNLIRSFGLA